MMATPATGLVGVIVLVLLLLARVPIGGALGVVGLAGLAVVLGPEAAVIKGGVVVVETLTRYELGTLPLFLLMAQIFFAADASRDLFGAAARFVGHRRGGHHEQRHHRAGRADESRATFRRTRPRAASCTARCPATR